MGRGASTFEATRKGSSLGRVGTYRSLTRPPSFSPQMQNWVTSPVMGSLQLPRVPTSAPETKSRSPVLSIIGLTEFNLIWGMGARKSTKKEESEDLGIGLTYVTSPAFTLKAQEATSKSNPSFTDMKKPFFLSGANAIGADLLCPRDLQLGCSFVDSVDTVYRQKATHFLSWVWR